MLLFFVSCRGAEGISLKPQIHWILKVNGKTIDHFDVLIDNLYENQDSARFNLELITQLDTFRLNGVPVYALNYSDQVAIHISDKDEWCALISVVSSDGLASIRPHTDISIECSYKNRITFFYRSQHDNPE